MLRLDCPDFDQFEEALSFVQGRYLLSQRTVRDWRLRAADFGDVYVMIAHEGAANAYHGACADFFFVEVPLSGHDLLRLNGERISPSTILWLAPGDEFAFRAEGVLEWACIGIRSDRVWEWFELQGIEANHLLHTLTVPSDAATIGRLVRLIRRVLWLEQRDPDALNDPRARELACADLIDTALAAAIAGSAETAKHRRRQHLRKRQILKSATGLIEASIDQPIGLNDLCRAANTSRRTLHSVFAEHLGMSPHQYLMRRRLHAVHMDLRKAKPSQTVTEICAQYGVWDVGRFAERYRRQFGILPSEMLTAMRQGA